MFLKYGIYGFEILIYNIGRVVCALSNLPAWKPSNSMPQPANIYLKINQPSARQVRDYLSIHESLVVVLLS